LEVKIGKIAIVMIVVALAAGIAWSAEAQTLEEDRAAEDLRDAASAGKRHRAELMKIPHVRIVTGEIDSQNDAAILVQVDDPKNVDAVTRQLPSKIEGFPVEVDIAGVLDITPGHFTYGKPSEAGREGEDLGKDDTEAATKPDAPPP
jgi:hypothetical protein